VANVSRLAEVPAAVATYLRANSLPLRAVCWRGLRMLDWLQAGVLVEERAANDDDAVGITETFCAIAETGTLMTISGEHTPPVTSLLPASHIAVVRESQIVPAMEEAWQRLRDTFGATAFMPRAVNFISGPSRTADIEQTLTFGAHGPYRVHLVLVAED
jgi:L-lactate dehydrogenase complex protein LldG